MRALVALAVAAHVASADPLDHVRREHPRLVIGPRAELEAKIKRDPIAARWYRELVAQGDALLARPSLASGFPPSGNKGRVVCDRLYLLGALYQLTGDKKWAARASEEMLAVARASWADTGFLELAETAAGMALGYDWTYDGLSDAARATIVRAIHDKAVAPGLDAYAKKPGVESWWRDSSSNWNLVSNGGLVLAALAIAGDDTAHPADARAVLEHALRALAPGKPSSVSYGLGGYGSDGAWAEGPDYWNYATRYFVLMLGALDTAVGSDLGLSRASKGFAITGDFPSYFTGPTGLTFNYADCDEAGDENGAEASPFLFRLGQPRWAAREQAYLAREAARGAITDRPSNLALELVWMQAVPAARDALPLDARFADQDLAFLRESWTDPKTLYFAIKGGRDDGPHHDADLGTFVLDADGARWALDLGKDSYALPGYGKYTGAYYVQSTAGHNTLTLGGANQAAGATATAPITKWHVDPRGTSDGVIDLTRAYAPEAARAARGFALDRAHRLVIVRDELRTALPAKRPIALRWAMHTRARATIAPDGRVATLDQTEAGTPHRLKVVVLAPAGARLTFGPAPAAKAGEHSRAGINVLALALDVSRGNDLIVAFVPESSPSFAAAPTELAKLVPAFATEPLARWP
ncbi:MAG TPA: heparinase II/III family protein [Kofleriaceae bacterium]|nr:heparinase II/III family protein [Kofleriaceae bacterium]